jgi:hypothetical protein
MAAYTSPSMAWYKAKQDNRHVIQGEYRVADERLSSGSPVQIALLFPTLLIEFTCLHESLYTLSDE